MLCLVVEGLKIRRLWPYVVVELVGVGERLNAYALRRGRNGGIVRDSIPRN